jgi:hypothetical protein
LNRPKVALAHKPELDGEPCVRVHPQFTVSQAQALDRIANDLTREWMQQGRYVRASRNDALVELVEQYRRNPPQIQEPDAT